jgi:hypothetical protein
MGRGSTRYLCPCALIARNVVISQSRMIHCDAQMDILCTDQAPRIRTWPFLDQGPEECGQEAP